MSKVDSDSDDAEEQREALSHLKVDKKNRAPVERVHGAIKGGAGRVQLNAPTKSASNNAPAKINVYQVGVS